MKTPALAGQPVDHPIPQLATFELRDLRQDLETMLAMGELPPYTRPRDELETMLAEVKAEQDDRERIQRQATGHA
jgi:hypothetical protein